MTEIELLEHVLANLKAGKIAGNGLIDMYGKSCSAKSLYQISHYDPDSLNIAPKTHIVNGFEVPAPESERLDNGDLYYYVEHSTNFGYAIREWKTHQVDDNRLKNKQVFLTKEAAILNQKAQAGIDPYGDEE